METTAIHSHKGGVGKTTICVNMAFLLASKGYNVCLIDNDYGGPNLYTFFPNHLQYFINDYVDGKVSHDKFLFDISGQFDLKGKLYIGFADPSPEATKASLQLNPQLATNMLRRQLKLKSVLSKDPYRIDYLLLDTNPGIGMTTINSFLLADIILFLIKMSNSDIIGTGNMISALIDSLYNRITLVANQIPQERIADSSQKQKLEKLILTTFKESSQLENIEFLGWIPSDPELQILEFENAVKELEGQPSKRMVYTLDQPKHQITSALQSITDKMFFVGN